MAHMSPILFLSQEERDQLREKVFELLWQKGVTMDHPSILKLIAEAGAHVNFEKSLVKFPRSLLEKILESVPRSLRLSAMDESKDLQIPRSDGTFHVRTNTGARSYLEPESGHYRDVAIEDVGTWGRLVNALDHIDFCGLPFPSDVPVETADIHALRTMLFNSKKHLWIQPYSAASIEYLIQLVTVAAGGEEELRRRPLASFITCSLTPLAFKFMDLEVIYQTCRRGIPVHACSLPSAGGTAPITLPGVVLLASAEILTMLAVTQVVQPGSPVIATSLFFSLDMATGRTLQASAEAIKGAALAVGFLKEAYGVPTHTYGFGADSPEMDGQSMGERALLGLLIAGARADILGGAGQIEVASAISPLQLMIDHELAGMVREIVGELKLDDETMAWEDLLGLPQGGHFLQTNHTLRHCRDFFRPQLFIRQSREVWEQQGRKELSTRTREAYEGLKERGKPKEFNKDTANEINGIVETADRNLIKKGYSRS